jgi:DNA mismatch repair protein MLH3
LHVLTCAEYTTSMVAVIRPLPLGVAQTITSQGQIITLSDVVRELVHNGIDAQANNITVTIRVDYASDVIDIEYLDDGCGIGPESLVRFGESSCTSKYDVEGNWKGFGFRGEGLSCVLEVCRRATIVSRIEGWGNGLKLQFQGSKRDGKCVKNDKVVPRGTQIRVEGVFDMLVVRKKVVLENLRKGWFNEGYDVKKVVFQAMIGNPGVDVAVWRQERKSEWEHGWKKTLICESHGKTNDSCKVPLQAQMRVLNALFDGVCKNYEVCKVSKGEVQLKVATGLNIVQTRKYQFVFFNGRPFFNEELIKYINSVFQRHYDAWGYDVDAQGMRGQGGYMYGRPYSTNTVFVACIEVAGINVNDIVESGSKKIFTCEKGLMELLKGLFNRAIEMHFGVQKKKKKQEKEMEESDEKKSKHGGRGIVGTTLLKSQIRVSKYRESDTGGRIKRDTEREPNTEWVNNVYDIEQIQIGFKGRVKREGESIGRDEKGNGANHLHCADCNKETVTKTEVVAVAVAMETASATTTLLREDLAQMVVIGQVGLQCVLVCHAGVIYALDPHACDERIRLETVLAELATDGRLGVLHALEEPLCVPVELLGLEVAAQLEGKEMRERLAQWGVQFQFQRLPNPLPPLLLCTHLPTVVLRKVVGRAEGVRTLARGIAQWVHSTDSSSSSKSSSNAVPALVLECAKSWACQGAIRWGVAGDVLSRFKAAQLLKRLSECEDPFHCAHGRPSIVSVCRVNLCVSK